MTKNDQKLTKRLYLTEFFGESFAVYALIPLFFKAYASLDMISVGTLLAVWQLTTVALEIPTGVVADRFGRRASIQSGKFINIIALLIWLLLPNFVGLLVGVCFFSLGNALLSGSIEAYTFDELEDKKIYNKIRQRTVAIHLGAFSFAGLMAYFLNADYARMLVASIISAVIGFLLSLLLAIDTHQSEKMMQFGDIVRSTKHEIKKSKKVLYIFLIATITTSMLVFFIEQIPLFYSDTGITDKTVALLMAIGNILTFLILWKLHAYEEVTRKHQNLLLVTLFVLLGISLLFGNRWIQIGLIFLSVRIVRIMYLHASNDLQHVIKTGSRATIISTASFLGKIFSGIGIFSVGILSGITNDSRISIFMIGFFLIVLVVILSQKSRRLVRAKE
ncbi:MAG TPA: MFS transporter [Candidatus Saccharibacteria bacterium]|jgi:MFS family permease|nr:MFS transporter [Candidatus Saccharibacteria bacterium]HMT55371.1 MFS transporter [Candidatus Saccharibacteria bacterium]